jgi:hypothetical protein
MTKEHVDKRSVVSAARQERDGNQGRCGAPYGHVAPRVQVRPLKSAVASTFSVDISGLLFHHDHGACLSLPLLWWVRGPLYTTAFMLAAISYFALQVGASVIGLVIVGAVYWLVRWAEERRKRT